MSSEGFWCRNIIFGVATKVQPYGFGLVSRQWPRGAHQLARPVSRARYRACGKCDRGVLSQQAFKRFLSPQRNPCRERLTQVLCRDRDFPITTEPVGPRTATGPKRWTGWVCRDRAPLALHIGGLTRATARAKKPAALVITRNARDKAHAMHSIARAARSITRALGVQYRSPRRSVATHTAAPAPSPCRDTSFSITTTSRQTLLR